MKQYTELYVHEAIKAIEADKREVAMMVEVADGEFTYVKVVKEDLVGELKHLRPDTTIKLTTIFDTGGLLFVGR